MVNHVNTNEASKESLYLKKESRIKMYIEKSLDLYIYSVRGITDWDSTLLMPKDKIMQVYDVTKMVSKSIKTARITSLVAKSVMILYTCYNEKGELTKYVIALLDKFSDCYIWFAEYVVIYSGHFPQAVIASRIVKLVDIAIKTFETKKGIGSLISCTKVFVKSKCFLIFNLKHAQNASDILWTLYDIGQIKNKK